MSDEEKPAAEEAEEQPGFVASETFAGARDGYKFEVSPTRPCTARLATRVSSRSHHRLSCRWQSGPQGVGYYLDEKPEVAPENQKLQVFETEDISNEYEEPDNGMLWAIGTNFMGSSPTWYKQAVAGFLVANLVIRFAIGKPAAAWAVLLEFIFTLAMATNCYPLQPGGLIVIQGYAMNLAPASRLEYEVEHNIDILLLVIFMVACVHFLKNLLLWIFTNLLIKVTNKTALSVGILLVSAVMSAFMDALSVSAVLISVCSGVLGIYYQAVQKVALPTIEGGVHHDTMEFELVPHHHHSHAAKKNVDLVQEENLNPLADGSDSSPSPIPRYDTTDHAQGEVMMFPGAPMQDGPQVVEPDGETAALHKQDIIEFRDFLRSILMHGAVGTAVGGCTTLVGEPQNLVIAKRLGWDFLTFAEKMAPITVIVWPAAVVTCIIVETAYKGEGYGSKMPTHVRMVLREFVDDQYGQLHSLEKSELLVQGVSAVFLVIALCAHLTEVGFVGLAIAIIVTTMNGECEEHDIAHAFLEAMPFVSLLVVFFGVVAIIEEQHIFQPIINAVLGLETSQQPVALYLVNGFLSMVSDNVFVVSPQRSARCRDIAALLRDRRCLCCSAELTVALLGGDGRCVLSCRRQFSSRA